MQKWIDFIAPLIYNAIMETNNKYGFCRASVLLRDKKRKDYVVFRQPNKKVVHEGLTQRAAAEWCAEHNAGLWSFS